jgi:hypothetical protein
MKNHEIAALLADLQKSVDQLISRVDRIEREFDDYRFDSNSQPRVSSYTCYGNNLLDNSSNVDDEYYSISEFDIAGIRLAAMNTYDLEKVLADIVRTKRVLRDLGDINTLKENIYSMAAEVDQMQKNMIQLINNEGSKALNKIRDLASKTDTAKIDNKELLLDKDEE